MLTNLPWLPSLDGLDRNNDSLAMHWQSGGVFYIQAGWPHAYLDRQYNGSTGTTSDKWMLDGLATNFLLGVPTILLLVYSLQFWLPRLSIKVIMLGVALVALIVHFGVTLAGYTETQEEIFRFQLYVVAIFLLPLVIGVVLLLLSIIFDRHRMFESKPAKAE